MKNPGFYSGVFLWRKYRKMKILVRTLFDCSATGITGNFRLAQLPFRDKTNNVITDIASWSRSRNQQRNWETLMQVLGLRCQLNNVEDSQYRNNAWEFTFEVENPDIFGINQSLQLLRDDCDGVPMLIIQDSNSQPSILHTHGSDQNIWFETINN